MKKTNNEWENGFDQIYGGCLWRGKTTGWLTSCEEDVKEFIRSLLTQARQEEKLHTIATIRNWMKGKNIDKEKMRQYLNVLRKEV